MTSRSIQIRTLWVMGIALAMLSTPVACGSPPASDFQSPDRQAAGASEVGFSYPWMARVTAISDSPSGVEERLFAVEVEVSNITAKPASLLAAHFQLRFGDSYEIALTEGVEPSLQWGARPGGDNQRAWITFALGARNDAPSVLVLVSDSGRAVEISLRPTMTKSGASPIPPTPTDPRPRPSRPRGPTPP